MTDTNLDAEAIQIFEEALEQPSNKRADWIQAKTRHSTSLYHRVIKLLDVDNNIEDILRTGGALDESIGIVSLCRDKKNRFIADAMIGVLPSHIDGFEALLDARLQNAAPPLETQTRCQGA